MNRNGERTLRRSQVRLSPAKGPLSERRRPRVPRRARRPFALRYVVSDTRGADSGTSLETVTPPGSLVRKPFFTRVSRCVARR